MYRLLNDTIHGLLKIYLSVWYFILEATLKQI